MYTTKCINVKRILWLYVLFKVLAVDFIEHSLILLSTILWASQRKDQSGPMGWIHFQDFIHKLHGVKVSINNLSTFFTTWTLHFWAAMEPVPQNEVKLESQHTTWGFLDAHQVWKSKRVCMCLRLWKPQGHTAHPPQHELAGTARCSADERSSCHVVLAFFWFAWNIRIFSS